MCIIVLFGCCAKASRICHFLFHRYQKIANYSMSCGLLQSFWYEIQTTWVWKLILSAATTVDKFLNNQQSESTNITIWIVFMKIIRSPITLLYYFYLWLPLFWFTLFIKYIELILRISARRSPRVKNLLKHIVAFSNSVENLYQHVRKSHLLDIINWVLQTCFEVVFTAINGSAEREMEEDCAELLLYEEFQDKNPIPPSYKKRMRMLMHYDVSSNPFFASVRLHSHSRGQTPLRTRANTDWSEAGSTTPGSIPPSPNLRALCLGKSFDKVNNVLYTARDKLRLEARRSDSDDLTKRTASKLIDKGKFGTYDPFHTAQNIRLSNGNHCARRISLATRSSPNSDQIPTSHPMDSVSSSSTRSSLSVMRNAYVYIEYFVKSNRSPSVTMSQLPRFSASIDPPPIGQIDVSENRDNTPPSPSPIPAIQSSPTKRYNGDGPGVYLGIASCDFPLHGGVPVGLSEKSVSISPNGFINISSGSSNVMDDSDDHGHNVGDHFAKSYAIQAHLSSGDRIGILMYLSSSNVDDDIFTPGINLRPQKDGENETDNFQSRGSGSWASLGLALHEEPSNTTNDLEPEPFFEITFNLNGYPIQLPWEAQSHLAEISWGDSLLYPTVSFLDAGTSVWSGFSSDDVIHRDRKSIGAPPDVVVYCLDGSVLLERNE